jgi:hypothetical protein
MKIKKKLKLNKFIEYLFDFSFKRFITTSVIKLIFWINVIAIGILGIMAIIGGFKESFILGILALIFTPIFYIIYVAIIRMLLELIAVIFRIGEYTEEIAENITSRKRIDDYKTEDKEK